MASDKRHVSVVRQGNHAARVYMDVRRNEVTSQVAWENIVATYGTRAANAAADGEPHEAGDADIADVVARIGGRSCVEGGRILAVWEILTESGELICDIRRSYSARAATPAEEIAYGG